jgi:hypothetical protein
VFGVDSVVLVAEWPSRSMEVEIKFNFYIKKEAYLSRLELELFLRRKFLS